MTEPTASDLVDNPEARRASYDQLVKAAQEILTAVTTVLAHTEDQTVAGWHIRHIPVTDFRLEITLCESTEDHVPLTILQENAHNVLVMVRRGLLHVTYDDALGGFDVQPENFVFLPEGIRRTTFAVVHPTTLFTVLIRGKATDEQLSTAYRGLVDS